MSTPRSFLIALPASLAIMLSLFAWLRFAIAPEPSQEQVHPSDPIRLGYPIRFSPPARSAAALVRRVGYITVGPLDPGDPDDLLWIHSCGESGSCARLRGLRSVN